MPLVIHKTLDLKDLNLHAILADMHSGMLDTEAILFSLPSFTTDSGVECAGRPVLLMRKQTRLEGILLGILPRNLALPRVELIAVNPWWELLYCTNGDEDFWNWNIERIVTEFLEVLHASRKKTVEATFTYF